MVMEISFVRKMAIIIQICRPDFKFQNMIYTLIPYTSAAAVIYIHIYIYTRHSGLGHWHIRLRARVAAICDGVIVPAQKLAVCFNDTAVLQDLVCARQDDQALESSHVAHAPRIHAALLRQSPRYLAHLQLDLERRQAVEDVAVQTLVLRAGAGVFVPRYKRLVGPVQNLRARHSWPAVILREFDRLPDELSRMCNAVSKQGCRMTDAHTVRSIRGACRHRGDVATRHEQQVSCPCNDGVREV